MSWLTNLFSAITLNPGLAAAGIGLVAAPIVIHIINRMRFRTVHFAAMEFLLASQQKNRRRVLLEQLLLLLLRILIVAALVFLIARLILDPSTLSFLRAGATTHHVILLDDSGSMRNQLGEETAFEKAKSIVRQFASEAARHGSDQQLTVMLLSQAQANEAILSRQELNEHTVRVLSTRLNNLSASHQSLDFQLALAALQQRLAASAGAERMLHVISDFRRADWLGSPADLEGLVSLSESGVSVNLVRVVEERTGNLGVTTIEGDLQALAAGVPARIRVGVTNFGAQMAEDVSVSVAQDEQRLPLSRRFARIEPGSEVFTEFDVAFPTPGHHALRFSLEGDALPADDRRFVAVEVAPSLPVLIIAGTPGQGDGPGLVADALAPEPDLSGLNPRIERVSFLRRNSLEGYRAIFLINVPKLPRDIIRVLERYVKKGGGIAWFLGNAVQPRAYNTTLYAKEAEQGEDAAAGAPYLFPVPLAETRLDRQRSGESDALDIVFEPVGRFAAFAGELGAYWRGSHVSSLLPPAEGWQRDDEKRADGVTTVAHLQHGEPIILRHEYGRGTIVTVLTSAGQMWTNWPRQFIYVPFLVEMFKELAGGAGQVGSRPVGTPLVFQLPAGEFDSEVRIIRPDDSPDSLRLVPVEPDNEGAAGQARDGSKTPGAEVLMLQGGYRQTDQPGIYKALTAPVSGGSLEADWYALNAPSAESRLALADSEELAEALGGAENIAIRAPGETGWLRVEEAGREARLWLIGLLIAFLVAEQALAYRLSYHPKRQTAPAH